MDLIRKLGQLPKGERLARVKASPNYKNGSFTNISNTPDLSEDASYFSVMWEFIFGQSPRVSPKTPLPYVKTDLSNLGQNRLVWLGHSSYFIKIDDKNILVDPVLSGNASPFNFTTKAFQGSNPYTADDIPPIDYLFLSHDHYDHLDYETICSIKNRVKKVITGLGTGQHLEYWGYDSSIIIEKDWDQEEILENGFKIMTVSARHFSGRGLKRNQVLWLSFILKTPNFKLFLGGDSGYDSHFKSIGDQYGPFDLAILENGQYDRSWKYIHLLPSEFHQAAYDLNAKRILPVHSGKFALANHPWEEPFELVVSNNTLNLNIITPKIGDIVRLDDVRQKFEHWWQGLD